MSVFDRLRGHEEVVFFNEPSVGLRAIVAIYSTALGPAAGGTRFRAYASEDEALDDVLALSEAMAYKCAVAGLDLGGGKAVIIGDPARDKTPELLHAYGRALQTLNGRYYTACDVGTYVEDMDTIAEVCDFVTGGSPSRGGAGDSSILTAVGVFQAMRAAAQHVWGVPTLRGKRVAMQGAGKVGARVAAHLLADGAQVVITDVDTAALDNMKAVYPAVEVVGPDEIASAGADVFSPCALGGTVTHDVQAQIVCGGANNQLAGDDVAPGVIYVPDFVANAGGIIQVGAEVRGYSEREAERLTMAIFDTTLAVLQEAARTNASTVTVAQQLAEARMATPPAG